MILKKLDLRNNKRINFYLKNTLISFRKKKLKKEWVKKKFLILLFNIKT